MTLCLNGTRQSETTGKVAVRSRRTARILWAIVQQRCPRCRIGRIFRGTFAMNDPCPRCGLLFQREEGYFLGAMYFSYAISLAILVPLLFAASCSLASALDNNLVALLATGLLSAVRAGRVPLRARAGGSTSIVWVAPTPNCCLLPSRGCRLRQIAMRTTTTNRITSLALSQCNSRNEGKPVKIHTGDTAFVIIDPQNDVLSEKGVSWELVGESVEGKQHRRKPRAPFQSREGTGLWGLHLASLSLPRGPGVAVWRSSRDDDAGEQGVLSPRPAQSRSILRLGGRLARALQALHRGRGAVLW